MQSGTTRQFWRLFSHLPAGAQRDAKRSYRLFQTNPAHPGLQFKKLEGEDNRYHYPLMIELRGYVDEKGVLNRFGGEAVGVLEMSGVGCNPI